ncbi:MAG: chemotaxis protein CheA [Sphingomonas sp.]|nr:chemotaxis protein CheA [Sphingomonas sp.]
MDDLIADFVAECREMLEALGGEIVAWEAAPDDRARLDSIFRFVHTVKGNCGFFELPRLEALSHAAEDALADVRAGRRAPDAALVTAVLAIIDRIAEMIEMIDAGEQLPDGDDDALVEALEPSQEEVAPANVAVRPASSDTENKPAAAPRTIRLSVELLDRVMSGVSDMVLARNELARRLREADTDVDVDGAFERLSGIIAEMRDAITQTRMQRIENLFVMLPRMVRDLSAELDKQVMVDIDGGDVELDREMIEMIRDPLTHIIRNAVDHGIEAPADRLAAGKREIGLLKVSARQSGNQILIHIEDDGKGIDGDKLVAKAIQAGALDPKLAESFDRRQELDLIFAAGLSTAQEVSSISGRGVGMDVVRSNIERIGGVVDVESEPGQGTRMTLRVPLTLTIIPALTVTIAGQHFAIPRSAIDEIVRANSQAVTLETIGGSGVVTIRDRRIPQIVLADVLSLQSDVAPEERTLIVLQPAGGETYALAVDHIHDHEELVVKPAAPSVMATGIYAGTTLADDGSPILLFDAAGVAEAGGVKIEGQRDNAPVGETEDTSAPEPDLLVFRALDGKRRALHLGLVDRIEEVKAEAVADSAGRQRVQLGESILPLAGLDGDLPVKVRVFRLSDGENEIAYAFDKVLDQCALEHEVTPADTSGEIAGVALVGAEPAEILDIHWLFANMTAKATARIKRRCRLPADDPWMQHMLRPIVEAVGYEVVTGGEADLVIKGEGETMEADENARCLVIRARPEGDDSTIYRYDRAGLMLALKSAGGAA